MAAPGVGCSRCNWAGWVTPQTHEENMQLSSYRIGYALRGTGCGLLFLSAVLAFWTTAIGDGDGNR